MFLCSVITGARFVKLNRTIFVQIQEGKLMPFGGVDPSSVRWVKVNESPRGILITSGSREFVENCFFI